MRVRILAYYHDLIGKLLAEGQKPTSIHRCLLAEGAQVSRSAIKQYIAKYPSFPASGDLYLQGCQRVMVPSTPSSAPQVGLPSAPAAKKSKRALAPYLTKLVQTEVPAHTEATRTLGGISSPLWQAKKEWWSDLCDEGGRPLFELKSGKWAYSGATPNLTNTGLYAYIGAHLYARTVFPEEIRRDLQRISMQISARVTLNLTQKLSEGKVLFGFVPTFAQRDRGMNEWKMFQKLPRAWRRKIIVEGTLGGYFLPLSMAWAGAEEVTGDIPLLDEPEYVLPEEFDNPLTQRVVPAEYLDLLVNKEKLTDKLYWKTF